MSEIITISVNGTVYENFKNVSVFKSIESFLGSFEFSASNTKRKTFPFSKGDSVEIFIDDEKIITGFINNISGDYDSGSHSIRISGRDRTQDLVDSSIKSSIDFKAPIGIKSLVEKVLKVNGLTDIGVELNETVTNFSKNELISANVGENAFQFIERYCQLKQLLLTTNAYGNIELLRAGTNEYELMLLNEQGGVNNNILRASFSDSDDQRFNEYTIYSQGNLLSQISDNDVEKKKGSTSDSNVRSTRILVINLDKSCDVKTCIERAKWESNIRRTRGFWYKCRIRVFYTTALETELIKVNNQIVVRDDMFGINSTLLIKSCRYIKSLNGTFLDLELVNKDSFTLQQEQDAVDAKFDKKDDILSKMGI